MCNLEYESLSMKYFIPGNNQILITVSSDKDLKRMFDFHENSITTDVFIMGRKGFKHEDYMHASSGRILSSKTTNVANAESKGPASVALAIISKKIPATITKDPGVASLIPTDLVTVPVDTTVIDSVTVDMNASPADSVKKRRRIASWNISDSVPSTVLDDNYNNDNDEDSVHGVNSKDVSMERMVASWKKRITGVGQDFKNVAQFRDALHKYYIARRFGIKQMNKLHTCEEESWKRATPNKNWLVSVIKDRLRQTPCQKPKDIAHGLFQDFGMVLNYSQVWRGIEDAKEQLQGFKKEAYNLLPWFCDKIVETNPGSFVKLSVDGDRKFQRLFVSFHASIYGFQNGCRPILFLDSTTLKSKYHEILLTATALDGDDGLFLVSIAIVDIENSDNWKWFLEKLKIAISTSQSVTFASDKEKGLMKSLSRCRCKGEGHNKATCKQPALPLKDAPAPVQALDAPAPVLFLDAPALALDTLAPGGGNLALITQPLEHATAPDGEELTLIEPCPVTFPFKAAIQGRNFSRSVFARIEVFFVCVELIQEIAVAYVAYNKGKGDMRKTQCYSCKKYGKMVRREAQMIELPAFTDSDTRLPNDQTKSPTTTISSVLPTRFSNDQPLLVYRRRQPQAQPPSATALPSGSLHTSDPKVTNFPSAAVNTSDSMHFSDSEISDLPPIMPVIRKSARISIPPDRPSTTKYDCNSYFFKTFSTAMRLKNC
ncbi:hypothetical protein SADUNF_Sadunf06G0046000 [Salix dunnii]|uniref:MULE transposase domain-containing protein n=1 Tax=Salix dunnii TaxID=1413687 RepID=A0A835JXN1_9ROSI|nr:hypothetical protein SADUNF_Sadunf06G0046000 [Salix dunnii]